MGYSQDAGYIPLTINEMLITDTDSVMNNVNTQFGTTYTADSFVGTNLYKYFYALIQRLQLSEVKTSEIFLKLQEYFVVTNENISRPVVTSPGIIEKLESEGYIASVKPMIDADAGKANICVDKVVTGDDPWESAPGYATDKLAVNTILSGCVVGGVVTQGTETSAIVLSNGQSFDFKYALPSRQRTYLRLTTNVSENNQVVIETPEARKATLLANIAANYSLGKNFEPDRYYSISDSPWSESILLEWSSDNANWHSTVFDADFDDLFECALEDITLVEN